MITWIVLPLLGAVIGWVTNHLALWMLFHPYREVNILGFRWQGAIPRRREALAVSLSLAIKEHLLTPEDHRALLDSVDIQEHMEKIVTQVLQQQIPRGIFRLTPATEELREKLIDMLRRQILQKMPKKLSEIDETILVKVASDIDVAGHVRGRLMDLSLRDLESLIRRVVHREFVAIEISGAILGLLIGLAQAAIATFLGQEIGMGQ